MATNRTFQGPKGTRDFYPPEMAIRRHIERVWHSASVDSGFEEIEGPMFESLELYTVTSGPEIVSQLFSFSQSCIADEPMAFSPSARQASGKPQGSDHRTQPTLMAEKVLPVSSGSSTCRCCEPS